MGGGRGLGAVPGRGLLIGSLLVLIGAVLPVAAAQAQAPPAGPTVTRIAGPNRYATASALSASRFAPGAPAAFVATGADFADALAAAPAAAAAGVPLLLATRDAVPAETAAELGRLRPQRIVAVGGPAVLSDTALAGMSAAAVAPAVRVAGVDRYATAAALSATTFPAGVPVAYVASGVAFTDALAAAAAAGARRAPLLLVLPGAVPDRTAAELDRLRPREVVVVGGTGAVSAGVATALERYATRITRLAGGDRYGTAVAVSRATWPQAAHVYLASGVRFPDALTAAAAAGGEGAPLLPVPGFVEAPAVAAELARLGATAVSVVGGTGVIAPLDFCRAGEKPAPAEAPQVIGTVPGAHNEIALTFDMGGRTQPAVDILSFLVEQQVCATIFPTGVLSQHAEGAAAMSIVRAYPQLFEVGNHTTHHCNLVAGGGGSPTAAPCPAGRPSAAFVAAELRDAATVIQQQTGRDPAPYWRPPYGAFDQALAAAAVAAGYTHTYLWTVDTVDWRPVSSGGPTAEQIAAKVLDGAVPGAVVLLHLGGYETRAALPQIVSGLRARGFELTTLSDIPG